MARRKLFKSKLTTEAVSRPIRNRGLTAMTEMELLAAVNGKLKPRTSKGDKDQDSLRQVAKNGMSAGRPLGVTTGLPVYMAICYIFQENERRRHEKKLTDAEITEWLKKEFPGRDTNYFARMQWNRCRYNTGILTRGMIPSIQSHRYDSGGAMIDPTPGRGRPSKISE